MPRNPPINVQLGIAEISLEVLSDRKGVIVYFAPNGATLQKKDVNALIGALQELQATMA
jgi:hypothetical protein